MSEQSKAAVKGYVVRGLGGQSGQPVWCYDGFFRIGSAARGDTAPPREYPSLSIAGGGVAAMLNNGCTNVEILRRGEDGTETPLPSYEEAVNKLSLLREMATAALDWQRPGGMRPNHPPELAGCPASALREILRIVGRDVPAPTDSHDLTPSQVALSIALGAWETWPGDRRDQSAEAHALRDLGETFKAAGLAVWTGAECVLTDEGRALLARARAAGVLGVSTEETARLRGELDLKTAVLKMRDDKIAALQAVLASGAPDVPLSTAERAAWARYVNAAIDDRDAQIAEEHYQDGAEEGRARTKAALDAATDALRALCVDVDALLSAAEGQ